MCTEKGGAFREKYGLVHETSESPPSCATLPPIFVIVNTDNTRTDLIQLLLYIFHIAPIHVDLLDVSHVLYVLRFLA